MKKGTTLWRKKVELAIDPDEKLPENPKRHKIDGNTKIRTQIQESNCDLIGDQFWRENPELLEPKVKA